MAYRKMTVEYILDDREIEALEELLEKWQQYKGKDGSQPFEDWKLEDLFQAIMQYGCKYDISKHIKTDQYRHELMPTYWEHLVHEYTGLNVNEIEELEYIDYLQYRRDAFVHEMNKTEEGREYLENAHRLTQTEPDRMKARSLFGKKG